MLIAPVLPQIPALLFSVLSNHWDALELLFVVSTRFVILLSLDHEASNPYQPCTITESSAKVDETICSSHEGAFQIRRWTYGRHG